MSILVNAFKLSFTLKWGRWKDVIKYAKVQSHYVLCACCIRGAR